MQDKFSESFNECALDFSIKEGKAFSFNDSEFDLTKPSGVQKRIMDITKAKQEFDFNTKTDLKNGLEETIEWYKNNKSDHLKKQNYFIND